ncbi:TPA: tyrosine-type recombinase/integrase [Serratia odorifera]
MKWRRHYQVTRVAHTNSILLCREGSKTHREWLVPIVNFARERMRILIDRAINQGAEPEDYLFDVDRFKNPLGEVGPEPEIQPVRSFFTRLTKECGFKVTPHRFRHTLATEMMKSPDRNLAMVKKGVSVLLMEYIELDLKITGKALESELAFYMDIPRIPASGPGVS